MNIEILDNLILEGESLTQTISFVPVSPGSMRTYKLYQTYDKERYQDWQSSVLRFIKTYHSSDLEEMKEVSNKLSPENHRQILSILRAIKLLPNEPEKRNENKASTNNININNSQNQTVSQQLTLNIFLDAIKDEITGKDFKALKEIMKDYDKEPEVTKGKIIDKIKGFGGDVLSNIVANILTNPTIYNGLF